MIKQDSIKIRNVLSVRDNVFCCICICSHINKSINEFQFYLRRYIIHITTRTTTTTT